jgi:hypothetical protein
MMKVSATAQLPTLNGSKYPQQLCKHWAHNLAMDFTAERGTRLPFPATPVVPSGRRMRWSR